MLCNLIFSFGSLCSPNKQTHSQTQQETNNNLKCLGKFSPNANCDTDGDYNKNHRMLVLQKRIRLLRDEAENNEQRTMHFDIVLNFAATRKFV